MKMTSFGHKNSGYGRFMPVLCFMTLTGVSLVLGCGTQGASGDNAATGNASGATSLTGHLYCPYSASVENAGLGMTSTVSTTCDDAVRAMTANGIPDHPAGTFPNPGNPHTISPQTVNFRTSLNPAVTNTGGTAVAHITGYANNGIKFDPSTAESYHNEGVWNVEALHQNYFAFGNDSSNAHVQPNGSYHYHGMPEGYIDRVNPGQAAKMTLVGFAIDGFPVYARWGYTIATDASSAVKVITSSYRMKAAPASGRPSTAEVEMGVFTQDFEYVAGLGDLDECNGRFGVTPEFPAGIYHYFITDTFPYIQRCIKGSTALGT